VNLSCCFTPLKRPCSHFCDELRRSTQLLHCSSSTGCHNARHRQARPWVPSLKQIGHNGSRWTRRIGHLVPVWQPCIGHNGSCLAFRSGPAIQGGNNDVTRASTTAAKPSPGDSDVARASSTAARHRPGGRGPLQGALSDSFGARTPIYARTSGMRVAGSVTCVASSMTTIRKTRPASRASAAPAHVHAITCARSNPHVRDARQPQLPLGMQKHGIASMGSPIGPRCCAAAVLAIPLLPCFTPRKCG
jgi:hypothetical protein